MKARFTAEVCLAIALLSGICSAQHFTQDFTNRYVVGNNPNSREFRVRQQAARRYLRTRPRPTTTSIQPLREIGQSRSVRTVGWFRVSLLLDI